MAEKSIPELCADALLEAGLLAYTVEGEDGPYPNPKQAHADAVEIITTIIEQKEKRPKG